MAHCYPNSSKKGGKSNATWVKKRNFRANRLNNIPASTYKIVDSNTALHKLVCGSTAHTLYAMTCCAIFHNFVQHKAQPSFTSSKPYRNNNLKVSRST